MECVCVLACVCACVCNHTYGYVLCVNDAPLFTVYKI